MVKDGEHIAIINMSAGGPSGFRVPKNGTIRGVYANVPVNISIEENGTIGGILTGVSSWEPIGGFSPAPSSALVFNATAPTNITIRFEVN